MGAHMEHLPITPELYLKTLESLILKIVCVDEVTANCNRGLLNAGKTSIGLNSKTFSRQTPDEYFSYITYQLTGSQDDTVVLRIEATFCVIFGANERVPEGFSDIFNTNNLPLTTMPYFREIVASLTGRMGLPTFTIPYDIFSGGEATSEADQEIQSAQPPLLSEPPTKKPRRKKN